MYSTTHHHGQTHQRSHSTSIAPIDQFQFSVHQEQTTLVLGVLNYLERLEREVADMREFVKLGFRQDDSVMGDMGGGLAGRLEKYDPTEPIRDIDTMLHFLFETSSPSC